MSYFRPDLHRYLASQFADGILHKKSTLYYFLGRTYKWDDENYPDPLPNDSVENDIKIRDNIVYVKKLESNNVTLSIRRINWKKGTIYYQWDSTKEMNTTNADKSLKTPYYVMNSNYSIYKCLFNNHGAPSTEEPNEKNYGVLQTADGYLWKYMYSIPKIQLTRFLSGDYIPCQKAINESFYNLGAVESVVVRDGGMNYKSNTIVQALVDSPELIESYINEDEGVIEFSKNWLKDSEGNIIDPQAGKIYIVMGDTLASEESFKGKKYRFDSSSSSGEGYYEETPNGGATIESYINEGTGVKLFSKNWLKDSEGNIIDPQAGKIYIVMSEGSFKGKKYRFDSSSYEETLNSGVTAEISLNINDEGTITEAKITKCGRGYDSLNPPKITIVDQYGTGRGKYGNESAILKGNVRNGKLDTISIVDPGINYSNDCATKLIVIGDGSGCMVKPIIESGKIISVDVVSGGTGYTHAKVNIVTEKEPVPGYYGNADLIAVLGGSSISTDQGIVEQTATNGAIYAIEVTKGGSGYSTTEGIVKISIEGDGEGCSCKPVIVDGGIVSIKINDGGTGYLNSDYILAEDVGGGFGCSLSLETDENGTITKINVLNPGKDYKDTTKISVISKKGKGCSFTPIIKDGVLRYINVVSYGKNYTRGNIKIERSVAKKDTDDDAEAYPIISPIGGHGSDAVSELNASTATIYLALRYADAFGTLDQEFRQFGVISNLTSYKNLISTVYGTSAYLNDTNWLYNETTGLISKKLLEPIVSVYDPADDKNDSVQFKLVKPQDYDSWGLYEDKNTKGYIIDHVNVVENGNYYLSYKENIPIEGYYIDGKFYEDKSKSKEIKGEIFNIYFDLDTNKSYGWHDTGVEKKNKFVEVGEIGIKKNLSPSTTSVTLNEYPEDGGELAHLMPYIKGKVHSVDVLSKGYGFGKTEIEVYDNEILSDKKDNFIRPNISREGQIIGINPTFSFSSKNHYSNSTRLHVKSEHGSDAKLIPIIKGEIGSVSIVSGGSGYTSDTEISVISETGSGARLTPIIDANTGAISGVTIGEGAGGENYLSNNTEIRVTSSTGSGADLKPIILGEIVGVEVENYGKNYRFIEACLTDTSNSGSGCILDEGLIDGVIDSVKIDSMGKGYSDNISLTVIDKKGSGAILVPEIDESEGKIISVTVENGGENYSKKSKVVISDNKGTPSIEAKFTLVISDGVINSVEIDSMGKGYVEPSLIVEDKEGTGASLKASIDSEGRITSVIVENGGENYSKKAEIEITDTVIPSSKAKLTPVVLDGMLNSLTVLKNGEKYNERTTNLTINSNISYFTTDYKDPTADITFIGSIDSIVVTSQGCKYPENTTVKITRISDVRPDGEEGIYADAEAFTRYSPNYLYNKVCMVPLNEKSENFTLFPGYKIEYSNENEIQIYTIADLENDYVPIRTKDSTNIVATEENLCTIFAFKNYNENTEKYPGITPNCDLVFTVVHYNEAEKTENRILYRVINVTGKNILAQQISFIPRTINPSSTEYAGDKVEYTYTESDVETSVSTYVNSVEQCSIDKYSGNLLYVANMKPLVFFEGKVAAVRTNVYF